MQKIEILSHQLSASFPVCRTHCRPKSGSNILINKTCFSMFSSFHSRVRIPFDVVALWFSSSHRLRRSFPMVQREKRLKLSEAIRFINLSSRSFFKCDHRLWISKDQTNGARRKMCFWWDKRRLLGLLRRWLFFSHRIILSIYFTARKVLELTLLFSRVADYSSSRNRED